MKGYGIYVKNDLLEPKHSQAIGTSLWEYLWCLDKITSIDEAGVGKVLGGKPVKLNEITAELGISDKHISKHLKKLEAAGYINLLRTPYGFVITVNKAAKVFGNKENGQKVSSENGQKGLSSRKKVSSLSKKVSSNKTEQLDNTKTIVAKATKPLAYGNDEINKIYDYWEKQCGMPLPANKANRFATNNLLKKYNSDKLKSLIRGVAQAQGDRYAPTIGDMVALQAKVNDLLIWAKKNNQERIVKI